MTKELNIYVLHHANCFDGTGAKYAAWKKFKDKATYLPVQYGKPFPESVPLEKTTGIYILDFSYSKEILEDIHSKVGFVKVLDHHKTAKEALEGLDYAEFDMDRSGAVMAWHYFHPNVPTPNLIEHVQDGDLWKFEMNNTERVRAALPLLENNMGMWKSACEKGRFFTNLVAQGDAILASNKLKVDSIVKNNVKVLPYRGYKAGVYNTTTLVSESGSEACRNEKLGIDFSMSYFIDKEGDPFISLRSSNGFDVSALAKELGGGGHAAAAGAKVSFQFLTELYKGNL